MFSLFRKKAQDFFSKEEKDRIVAAIKAAEMKTSGEIRVYMESHCRFVDPVDRAIEIFYGLNMKETAQRNGVLVYIALKDHQLAIYGDEGIHQKVGEPFWNEEVKHILSEFNASHFVEGITLVIKEIGEALQFHFPYDRDSDQNELPDEIVFGR